jgi:hypothetical protein
MAEVAKVHYDKQAFFSTKHVIASEAWQSATERHRLPRSARNDVGDYIGFPRHYSLPTFS